MIVDAYALSNQVTTLVLRSRGFSCIAVSSEALALASMDEFRPDVVILEWASRAERRVEIVRRLRAFAEARGWTIAVIVVTYETALPPAEALSNVSGYFTKPVRLEHLAQVIERLAAASRCVRTG